MVVPKQERRLSTTQIIPAPFLTVSEGIYLDFPHLSREELVENLYQKVINSQFVLLSSPAGSGKTSLLILLVDQHPELNNIPIWFYNEGVNPTEILASHGISVIQRKCVRQDDKPIVFVLDDCQQQYRNIDFWTTLIKGVTLWMPKHIRFIFSATHLLETDIESPVSFGDIPSKLTRNDFLINDEEANQLINLDNGLPLQLRFPTLVKVIIRECNGHIASLRTSCNILSSHFSKAIAPVEEDVFSYYLSSTFVNQLARCFGTGHTTPKSRDLQLFLIKCLVRDPACGPLGEQLDEDEKRCMIRLEKAGIVEQDSIGYIKLTSPLAERYYSCWLFPNRASYNPNSLQELIRKVIASMSASLLLQSVVSNENFLKEAVFQHQFMEGLTLHTAPTKHDNSAFLI